MDRRDSIERWFWPSAWALLAIATWARCASFANVFTPDGVLLKPTDSHYYVRFALLQLESFPRFTHFDPWVNFPDGAWIFWPPVHTAWVALHVALTRANPEAGAAWAGVTATAAWWRFIAWRLRSVVGARTGLVALACLALLPVMIESSILGNADHHVHEPYLALTLLLGGIELARGASDRTAMVFGLFLGASRLLTTITVVLAPVSVVALLACGLLGHERSRRLARAALIVGGVSSGVSALNALLFGELRSLEFAALSGFLPLACVAGFGWAAVMIGVRGGDRRFAFALIPALAATALIARKAIAAGDQLMGDDPLLRVVVESQPLIRRPEAYVLLLGGVGLLVPLVALGAVRLVIRRRSPEALQTLVWIAALGAAFALQIRFVQPLSGPLALLVPLGMEGLLEGLGTRVRRVAAGVAVLAFASLAPALALQKRDEVPTDEALARNTLRWVRDHTPSPPDYAVLATHDLGHLLTLWARRPNVSSPFSQAPWHIQGNARAAAVLAATDDEAAYQNAVATRARYVVSVPFAVILGRDGSKDDATMARRLLEHAAMGEPDRPATAHFRLLHDSREERLRKEKGPYARVFEVVKGAVIVGKAPPGTRVAAELSLVTNLGRPLTYRREAIAGSDGSFRIRVAYPTTNDAEVRAVGPYAVRIGDVLAPVEVPSEAVRDGTEVPLGSDLLAKP